MEKKIIEDAILCIIKEELEIGCNQKIDLFSELTSIGVDSIALMTLLVFIEERFDFTVDEDILISNRFIKINDIVDYVQEKLDKILYKQF